MSLLDDARQAAVLKYASRLIEDYDGDRRAEDEYGYDETARAAFVEGVEWVLGKMTEEFRAVFSYPKTILGPTLDDYGKIRETYAATAKDYPYRAEETLGWRARTEVRKTLSLPWQEFIIPLAPDPPTQPLKLDPEPWVVYADHLEAGIRIHRDGYYDGYTHHFKPREGYEQDREKYRR